MKVWILWSHDGYHDSCEEICGIFSDEETATLQLEKRTADSLCAATELAELHEQLKDKTIEEQVEFNRKFMETDPEGWQRYINNMGIERDSYRLEEWEVE